MKYTSKSIKTVLLEHKDEVFMLCQSKSQFFLLQQKVNQLLDSEELKGNESVPEAKLILRNCSKNYNLYISTLMTYMTGEKVS